jgi:hypothetical protein
MFATVDGPFKHPTSQQVQFLYSSFMKNVDPQVKILHGPSLRRFLVEGIGTLDCSPGPRGLNALKFALFYITTTSLTVAECLERLGEDRNLLMSRFRWNTEIALAKADFLVSEELSVLQALVFYLVSLNSQLW